MQQQLTPQQVKLIRYNPDKWIKLVLIIRKRRKTSVKYLTPTASFDLYINKSLNIMDLFIKKGMYVYSKARIIRDENALCLFIYNNFDTGDYNILACGEGIKKGFHRFWDGLITQEGFCRRRNMARDFNIRKNNIEDMNERDFNKVITQTYINKYLKTSSPVGAWHLFNYNI